MFNESLLERIRHNLAENYASPTGITIPVGVSNRHVHLSQQDIETLFGAGYRLTPCKELRQPGQFAAKECVMIVGPKGSLSKVRVLGPARECTQLEISKADCFTLGLKAPVRESGNLNASGDAMLAGPVGYVSLHSQVICAQRHIHMNPQDAARLGVQNGQKVRVKAAGVRGLIFDEVIVRIKTSFALELHIDTDEANAAGLASGDNVVIVP
ncbi:phosphate propanoyltransferase [Serratia fonticola]|uniref:phosphate propanoyltransferase n=1 Tax=Serratia fonticola TaxID=47917 RepID=UPI003BB4978D